jgi:hypothetical protein
MAPPNQAATDLIELLPDPETLRRQLSESVKRTDLLRSLLRVARRKASYTRPSAPTEGGREKQ